MNILNQARENYSKVIAHHEKINYDTKLDAIWSNNMLDIAKIFDVSQTAEDVIDRIDQTFMYAINFPPENGNNTGVWSLPGDQPQIRDRQLNWLLNKLTYDISSLPKEVQESPYIHHRNKSTRDGRILSGNFLRTLSISQEVFKHCGEVKSIIELGGGCGHQARTFLLQIPNCKYTIVDLPETLFFSFTHLSMCFPDKKILYVTSEADFLNMDEYDIVFVPAVFADNLAGRNYDLFINTASLGEMRNDVIRYWMDLIQNKIKISYLFTLNRFLNVVDPHTSLSRRHENECSVSYDTKWEIINWELEPIYCRCPYIDTLHSRYVQIVAKRGEQKSIEYLLSRSEELLQDALNEDWNRLKGYYGDGLMQARINVLVNDMTMTGTLFKLWESIRLDQNPRNISAIINYTNRLLVQNQINGVFEEKYYYEGWLERNA